MKRSAVHPTLPLTISPEPSSLVAGEQQGPGPQHWEQRPQEQELQLGREQERAQVLELVWGRQQGREQEGAGQRPGGRSEEEGRRILGEASSLFSLQKSTKNLR